MSADLTDDEKKVIYLACIADYQRGWSGLHPDNDHIIAAVEHIVTERTAANVVRSLAAAKETP